MIFTVPDDMNPSVPNPWIVLEDSELFEKSNHLPEFAINVTESNELLSL